MSKLVWNEADYAVEWKPTRSRANYASLFSNVTTVRVDLELFSLLADANLDSYSCVKAACEVLLELGLVDLAIINDKYFNYRSNRKLKRIVESFD